MLREKESEREREHSFFNSAQSFHCNYHILKVINNWIWDTGRRSDRTNIHTKNKTRCAWKKVIFFVFSSILKIFTQIKWSKSMVENEFVIATECIPELHLLMFEFTHCYFSSWFIIEAQSLHCYFQKLINRMFGNVFLFSEKMKKYSRTIVNNRILWFII